MGAADVAGILRWGWRGWALVIGLPFLAILAISSVRLDGLPDLIVNECYRQNYAQNEQCPGYVVAWIALGWLFDFFHTHQAAVIALATVMIAIFTGTLFWSNIRLWRASDRSAEAAEKAIAESRKIGQAQVRAYLSVAAGTYEFYDNCLVLGVVIRNAGQSPSERGFIEWQIEYRQPRPDRGNLAVDTCRSVTKTTNFSTIGARSDAGSAIEFFFPEDGIDDAFFERMADGFLVHGMIRWTDVFDVKCRECFTLASRRDLEYVAVKDDGADSIGTLKPIAVAGATADREASKSD